MKLLDSIDTREIPWTYRLEEIVEIRTDRMYRNIPITPLAHHLIQTKQAQRLKWVSILGLLPGMTNLNCSASKLEHSIGVYFLGIIISRLPELLPFRNLICVATIGHDTLSPPFTHSSEMFQEKVLGGNHEELLSRYLPRSQFALVAWNKGGVRIAEAIAAMQGRHPEPLVNQVVNGVFDVDTQDGICRYLLSWWPVNIDPPYSPWLLANYFIVKDNELVLQDPEDERCIPEIHLEGYCRARKLVFDYINGPVIQAPQAQLERALHFAWEAGQLSKEFFFLTDEQATDYLIERCNKRTKKLIHAAKHGNHYLPVYERMLEQPSPQQIALLDDPDKRQEFADHIRRTLHIPPENICIRMGKHRGIRDLSQLKAFQEDGTPMRVPVPWPFWLAHAYLHPDNAHLETQVSELMDELLAA